MSRLRLRLRLRLRSESVRFLASNVRYPSDKHFVNITGKLA